MPELEQGSLQKLAPGTSIAAHTRVVAQIRQRPSLANTLTHLQDHDEISLTRRDCAEGRAQTDSKVGLVLNCAQARFRRHVVSGNAVNMFS